MLQDAHIRFERVTEVRPKSGKNIEEQVNCYFKEFDLKSLPTNVSELKINTPSAWTGQIDQIIINEEEEDIQSDNSFSYLLFVPKSGVEVRIVGNKNGQKIKELIFKIKVGK